MFNKEDRIAEFLDRKNDELNEYEVNSKSGKYEFGIKYAKLCISNESRALMIVFSDMGDKMQHRETQISEKMKTIMLCSISHELRSPLNQINGVLSLMQPTLK